MKLTFSGAGDDLIEVDGDINEEYSALPSGAGTFTLLDCAGAGVRIHVILHGDSGCWAVGVSPVEEEQILPDDWTFTISGQGGGTTGAPTYSAVLDVDAPGATLTWEGDQL